MIKIKTTGLIWFIAFVTAMTQNIPRPNIEAPNGIEVNVKTGNLFLQRTDLIIPGRGIDTEITFSFNTSLDSLDFGYGKGWTCTYSMSYSTLANKVIILRPDGRQDTFSLNGAMYQSPVGVFDKLEEYSTGKFRLKTKYGMKYFFDDAGHKTLTKIEDTHGNALTLAYSSNKIASLTNPSGRSLTFTFTNNHLAEIIDQSTTPNRIISFEYDAAGRLTCVTDPIGNADCYEYGEFNQITKVTDKRGSPVSVEYDGGRRVSRIVSCLGEQRIAYVNNLPSVFALGLLLPTPGSKTYLTEQNGGVTRNTRYSLDIKGRLIALQNANGNDASFTYDANNNLISFNDFNGNKYLYTYDSFGNVLTESDPVGKTAIYTYEPNFNKIASVKDRNGNITTFTYNVSNGNLLSMNAPLGVSEMYGYDAAGNLTSMSNSLGQMTSYTYAANGNLTDIQFPIGSQAFAYDGAGNLTQVTDANNNSVNFTYDALNRLLLLSDPLGKTTIFSYDNAGNLETETDPNGNGKSYEYDAFGRLIAVTIPAGTTNYEYDFFGNLTKITDANGHSNTYTYNAQNLVVSMTDAADFTTHYTYDANGNLLQKTQPNGKVITYAYDALNRLISQTYPENADYFGYDSEGNLISASNNDASLQFTYDALHRLKSKTIINWGKTVSYTYNAVGDRLTMTDPDGGITNYIYDDNHRLTSLTNPLNETTAFTYDAGGRMIQQDNANETYTTYVYDAAGQLLQLSNLKSTGDTLSFFAYTYDDYGNRLTMTDLTGMHYYHYDDSYRVDSVAYSNGDTETFTYDGSGNRIGHTINGISIPYSYNAADMIQSGDGATFTFDDNGNMTSKTDTSGTTTYEYDAQNRLWRVTLPGGATNVFRYDAFGTRISLTDTAATETRFVHDLDNMLMELNSGNETQARYTAGLSVDSWITMERSGESYYYHNDGLGSVTELSTAGQGVVNSYGYEIFGKIRNQTGGVLNSMTFSGRELDKEINLMHYRTRFLNPITGLFTSKDSFLGKKRIPQSLNKYVYVHNNPIINTDPLGKAVSGILEIKDVIDEAEGNLNESVENRDKLNKELQDAYFSGDSEKIRQARMNFYGNATRGAIQGGFDFGKFIAALLKGLAEGVGTTKRFFDGEYLKALTGIVRGLGRYYVKKELKENKGSEVTLGPESPDGADINIVTITSVDPNDILGPPGYDTLHWVNTHDRLGYTIRFENDPDFATAPAQRVIVTLPVDVHLNIQSFRLGDFGFGNYQFSVPANTSFYTTRLDLIDSLGVFVDVTAGIDLAQNEVFWIFQSVDPATGLPPTDPQLGFLPLNDTIQIDSVIQMGEGFVNFSIIPALSAVTGDTITEQADIVFDENAPIATNIWTNIVDAFPPSSMVDGLPPVSVSANFVVSWSGSDDLGGVGVSHYALYVQKDGGNFYLHQSDIDTTAILFSGLFGSTYSFYTRATDLVGNTEAEKTMGEASIYIGSDPLCLNVVNTGNDGLGSLRDAISCAQPGDTIYFDPVVYNDTIILTSGELLINKNLNILTESINNIYVDASQIQSAIEISLGSQIKIEGIKFIAGTNSDGSAISNEGILTLVDISIIGAASTKAIENHGILTVSGICEIIK